MTGARASATKRPYAGATYSSENSALRFGPPVPGCQRTEAAVNSSKSESDQESDQSISVFGARMASRRTSARSVRLQTRDDVRFPLVDHVGNWFAALEASAGAGLLTPGILDKVVLH